MFIKQNVHSNIMLKMYFFFSKPRVSPRRGSVVVVDKDNMLCNLELAYKSKLDGLNLLPVSSPLTLFVF